MESLRFHQQMESSGCFARMVSVTHLEDLKGEIERLHLDGMFDGQFYQESLANFRYELPLELPDARSIIVVAKPQPALTVMFRWEGREIPLTVPPTYADAAEVDAQVIATLDRIFRPDPRRFIKAYLPLKALATHSGLVSYGRNNITYLKRFGSYHRLTAFFTDLPCEEDQWQEMRLLAGCDTCRACLQACPTGAISDDRLLLRADRCLTYLNEKDTSIPFPSWVVPRTHNAIVGCMRCQRVCPYDREVQGWVEARGEFTEEETAYLLEGRFQGGRAAEMELRLNKVGLDLTILPRNLGALLQQLDRAKAPR